MNLQQLNPWNWFKHEDDSSSTTLTRRDEEDTGRSTANHPIMRLQQEIDQLFDEAFRGFGVPSRFSRRSNNLPNTMSTGFVQARVNIASDDKNYHISLEVPGLTEKDISLDLTQNVLTIRGEKKEQTETKDRQYYRVEHSYGSFERVLALPEDADQNGITANVKNGMLEITLPRKSLPESETKRIPINSNGNTNS